jgi:hypothetical protein
MLRPATDGAENQEKERIDSDRSIRRPRDGNAMPWLSSDFFLRGLADTGPTSQQCRL